MRSARSFPGRIVSIIMLTGWFWLDPLTSLIIVGSIFWGTWGLFCESLSMSLSAVPAEIDPPRFSNF